MYKYIMYYGLISRVTIANFNAGFLSYEKTRRLSLQRSKTVGGIAISRCAGRTCSSTRIRHKKEVFMYLPPILTFGCVAQ